jgi:hypothetical protein
VRKAALTTLNRLDSEVSIPDRLMSAWEHAPSEAPVMAGVLERLAQSPIPSVLGFGASRPHRSGLVVEGQGTIRGTLEGEQEDLWLRLAGLPKPFERTRPVVALPTALAEQVPLTWAGERPGLVPATAPVEDRGLHVVLGQGASAEEGPFRRMYLLNPEIGATSGFVDKS